MAKIREPFYIQQKQANPCVFEAAASECFPTSTFLGWRSGRGDYWVTCTQRLSLSVLSVWDLQPSSPYVSLALVSVCINEPWESYNLSSLKEFQNSKWDGCKSPHWWGCQRYSSVLSMKRDGNSKQMVPKPAFALPIHPGQKLISFSIFLNYVDLLHE